jgi:hypothetical protein
MIGCKFSEICTDELEEMVMRRSGHIKKDE